LVVFWFFSQAVVSPFSGGEYILCPLPPNNTPVNDSSTLFLLDFKEAIILALGSNANRKRESEREREGDLRLSVACD
jgi:hypothetical protein